MIVVGAALAMIGLTAGFWLTRRSLTAKPWLEQGIIGEPAEAGTGGRFVAGAGLRLFMAVVGILFALLVSAYFMRMDSPDWQSPPLPRLLVANTFLLLVSSLALQAAAVAARRNDESRADLLMGAGAGAAIAFLGGQLLAWRQLADEGYFLATNPGNSFFYLLTGLHGVHLAGGLAALGVAAFHARDGVAAEPARSALGLCAVYWHFLLAVWLVLYALLAGWGGDAIRICRALIA
jgi:cytochrome c oxidase subunit 3